MPRTKIVKVKQDFGKYGTPWWLDRARKYRTSNHTNILQTFRKMGWIPPTESKQSKIDENRQIEKIKNEMSEV